MAFGNSFNSSVIADGSITTVKYADDSVTEAKLNSAFKQTLFHKNLLINPNFQVIDTASGTIPNSIARPTASVGYEGGTNWGLAVAGSASVAYAFSSANESVTFTGAASTTAIYLLQRLESKDLTTLANKLATLTLSAEISNSLLTTVTWEVFRPTTTDNTHGTIATPTQTLIASGTWTVNSTLTRYQASFTLPALAAKGLEVRLRVGAQTSGTWVVSRLQLEESTAATNFSAKDRLQNILDCYRYFWKLTEGAIAFKGFVATAASQGMDHYLSNPVPMFAMPIATANFESIVNCTGTIFPGANFNECRVTSVAAGIFSANYSNGNSFSAYIP
jgi:hypothetical protein